MAQEISNQLIVKMAKSKFKNTMKKKYPDLQKESRQRLLTEIITLKG